MNKQGKEHKVENAEGKTPSDIKTLWKNLLCRNSLVDVVQVKIPQHTFSRFVFYCGKIYQKPELV